MNYIREYQKYKGLEADGIIGKKTMSVLSEDLGITDICSISHFIGQLYHESSGFLIGRENLNYSEISLKSLFKKYFNEDEYEIYARNPEKIANRIYSNRMGNSLESSGDGWKYRGVGPIQLTGKENIQSYFIHKLIDINSDPEIILKPEYYFDSAKFYFDKNNIWKYTKDVNYSSILSVSKIINLGNANTSHTPLNMNDREKYTIKYYRLFK